MTTIKASCPACGDRQLRAGDIECVEILGGIGWYAFTCTACGGRVHKPADAHIVDLLRSGEVAVVTTFIPPEATEAHHGAPLTDSDVADLVLDLALWDGRLTKDVR